MKKFIVALAAMVAVSVEAQEVMSLSLKDAVDNALQYSKQLQTSKQDLEIYKEKIREAKATGLPQANAQIGGTTNFGDGINFGRKLKMDALTLNASLSYTLSLQQLASVQIARLASEIYSTVDESTVLDVKANITDTYYALLVYKRNIEILEKNLVDLEDIQRHTEHSFEVGVCEQTDVDQIRVTASQLRNAIISTKRDYEVTKRLMVLQMGLPISTNIEPSSNLDDMIAEGTTAAIDESRLDLKNNVTYKQLEQSLMVKEATVTMYKRAYIPTLTVAYQYMHNIAGGSPFALEHTGNFTLAIPLFDGFGKDSHIKQAKLDVAKTQTSMALLQDNLMQSDEQYRYELNSAIDAYLLQKENLEVARRVLQNYKNKYNQGVLSSLDLTQANSNYLSAETAYASATMTLLQAHTKLNKLYNSFNY